MFPDTPAILFWVSTRIAAALIWRTSRGEWWYLLGVVRGATVAQQIYRGVSPVRHRRLARRCGRHAVLTQPARTLPRRSDRLARVQPVLWWNAEHGWVSFVKQFGRGFETSADAGFGNFGEFLGV